MSNNVFRKSISDMFPVIYDIVSSGGSVKLDVKGNSMRPLLRSERDAVILKKADVIKKYDVVLFKKDDGSIALHRIISIKDSSYTIAGDNQGLDFGIKHDALIAKAVEFQRGRHCISEKQIRSFGRFWFAIYPLRRISRKGLTWIKNHLPACIRSLKNRFR